MSVYLIIKSETSLVNKQDFDNWYKNEYLKEARKILMLFAPKEAG
jgi:hypothetical protein